jgi:hypothetical protein
LVAVNMVHLHTGKILMYGGENHGGTSATVWDPATNALRPVPAPYNVFCSGHSALADGRILVVGGHDSAASILGSNEAAIFDPVTESWTSVPRMAYRRWYPTATTLPDGRVLVTSGATTCFDCIADVPEIYNPRTNSWTQLTGARLAFPYYPFIFVLPDGRILNAGAGEHPAPARTLDLANQRWTTVDPVIVDGGSAVMYLPGQVLKLFALNAAGVPSVAHWVRLPSPAEDTTPPTPPGTLTAAGDVQRVVLGWSPPSGDVDVVRCNVHRATVAGFTLSTANRIAQLTGSEYTDIGLAPGTYYYRVTAEDAAGNVGLPSNEAAGTALPDTLVPTVSITAPANGSTLSGTVTITATATDDQGVAGVRFRVDGADLGAEDMTTPYSRPWDTWLFPNGTHVLTAVARDVAGNQTTSSLITVTVSNTTPPPATGLVAAYSFSEGSGTTTSDRAGKGNTGTLAGATWTTAGQAGRALSFDGVNDRVNVNDAASLDLTGGMTLEAWVYPTALSGWRTVVLKEMAGGLVYALYAHDNAPWPAAYVRLSGVEVGVTGVSPLPLNAWTHLATTYDGTTLRLYVNGVEAGSQAGGGAIQVSTGRLRVGGNAVWGEWLAGRIDEVRIYNRALSPAEIQADMASPVP